LHSKTVSLKSYPNPLWDTTHRFRVAHPGRLFHRDREQAELNESNGRH
jgi:hypothetical protein